MRNFTSSGTRKILALPLLCALFMLSFAACNGNTGDSAEAAGAGIGTQFVSDGGAGATLAITLTGSLTVGGQVGFFVTALDPRGAPLAFIRIFCESERGIAIIEPSSGGVAFESTGSDGRMSGVLGGLLPGSFLLECRAPEGFNLVSRIQIVITGSVPEGFPGFPGAAGGNLGGGVLIEETPDVADGRGTRIAFVQYDDGGERFENGPIDFVQGTCDPGTPADTSDDFPEPFFFNNYFLTVNNDSLEQLRITSVTIAVADGRGVTTTASGQVLEVAPQSTGEIIGLLTDFAGGTGPKTYAGTAFPVIGGTFQITFTVTAATEASGTLTLTRTDTVTFDNVNNCT